MKAIHELNDNALRGISGGGAKHLRDLDMDDYGVDQERSNDSERVGALRPTTRIFPD